MPLNSISSFDFQHREFHLYQLEERRQGEANQIIEISCTKKTKSIQRTEVTNSINHYSSNFSLKKICSP